MNNDSGSVEKLSHEERKRRTWPDQKDSSRSSTSSYMAMALPLMAMMMGGGAPSIFGDSVLAKKASRELKKCVLPGCDVMFLPEGDKCCCSKDHFLELRKLQKEKKNGYK